MGQSRNEATTTVDVSVGLEVASQRCARGAATPPSQVQQWPLSFGQSRLWFLEQLEPGSALYNIPVGLRMKGALDLTALQTALDRLVERHESLRTRFVGSAEEPMQVVEQAATIHLETIHLEAGSEAEREKKAACLMRDEINAPFDLGVAPLVRAKLLALREQEYLLLVTIHHIIADEWSLGIFFNELAEFYQAALSGRAAVLPDLNLSYPEFAIAQRESMQQADNQLEHWRQQLADPPGIFEIPSDRPRPAAPTFKGRLAKRVLHRDLVKSCADLARREHVTPFMLHLAAFYALLCRYSQQEDIIVGVPIANRNREETEGMIGFFVNTLLLRADLRGNPGFDELLKQVRRRTLEAYANQEVPVEKVVEQLHPERSLDHLPFTRVMFTLQNDLLQTARWGDLEIEFFDAATETAKFDLTFHVQDTPSGLIARAEYNCDLFEEATIARLLEHYEILLTAAVSESKTRLWDLPLLSQAERHQVIEAWNQTTTQYPRNRSIHDLFEEQARQTPNANAVTFDGVSLTYRELNERANQLARYLTGIGTAVHAPVAMCLERSPDMVVAMLAISKAGGAYVPLDPDYPAERLDYMLKDSGAETVVTQRKLRERFTANTKAVCIDSDWENVAREGRADLRTIVAPEDVAYIMYTSGSTGRPKGVAVPHRAIVRLVRNTNYIRFGPGDRVAQVSNVSFDAATFEVWGSLLNGGTLIGIGSEVLLSPADFTAALREQKISAMFLTAALFNQIASEIPEAFNGLSTLIVGGEALDPKWVRKILRADPPRRLLNGYGPTENTTFTCCNWITEVRDDQTNIPIGKPIANTQVYILDRNLNPMPIGVPGELHAAGDGLAQGYWRQERLTGERFIELNLGQRVRAYKTGDLARWLPTGEIEFLGRLDDQVKIRGFRIELGEIEAALGKHPAVTHCAVKVCGRSAEEKRLAAYYVCGHDNAADADNLREFLQRVLPSYMIPAAFVRMPNLPITANGKVDRRALPEPDGSSSTNRRTCIAPRDETERRLTRIWERVLGVAPVGIEDRFFDLGGHSLLAVRLVAAIEKEFGRKLRLLTIFQAQTVAKLAPILSEQIEESSLSGKTSIVEIQGKGTRQPVFLVHGAGGGMFWGYTNLSRRLGNDQPVYAFRSRGLDGGSEFESVEDMAAAYVRDLRRFRPSGPYRLGGYCFGGVVAYEMARQLERNGDKVELLALFNCSPPNSSYTRIPATPVWMARFIKNLGYWVNYMRGRTPAQRAALVRWKVGQWKRKLTLFRGAPSENPDQVSIGDLVDLSSFSIEERRVWEAHIRALLKYQPGDYNGKVHVFRSPGHPLWCSYEPDYGWGPLARGGVVLTIVPGAHEQILEEPCVEAIAIEMKELLAQQTGLEGKRVGEQTVSTREGCAHHAPQHGGSMGTSPPRPGTEEVTQYWRKQLDGAPSLLELPCDHSRPATRTCQAGEEQRTFSAHVAAAVRKLSAVIGISEVDLLMAATKAVLHRYSGQQDILLGEQGGELFVIRSQVSGEMPFIDAVTQVKAARDEASRHALPFQALVDQLGITKDQSYHPIVQVLFKYQDDGDAEQKATSTSFDLETHFTVDGGTLRVNIVYARDLFEPGAIQRMLGHLETLLADAIAHPEKEVAELSLLTPKERQTLLEDWTATHLDFAANKTIIGLFQEQVQRSPEAEALVCAKTRWTYRELNSRADAIAVRLQAMGVKRGDLVGICLGRSAELIAAILGTLKAGAAYVPMDPAYPGERLAYILSDAKARVVISERKVGDAIPQSGAQVVFVEDLIQPTGANRLSNLGEERKSAPGDLAYVIYTSGSTGQPKGVAIEHRSVVAFVSWARQVFTDEELSGVLAATSICFDLSVFEMFVPLSWGGKIIMAENALALPSLSAANEVRLINTVPSAMRELVRLKGVPETVKVVNLAGEPLSTALVDAIYGETAVGKVYDLYGPTETTTYSTFTLRQPGKKATIGRPLSNEQVYLLDSRLQPVPIGVPGELHIGGAGLARGYLNRPELTNEKFIQNPFKPGTRLYKTGDLARWRADGNLEFLGRRDNQVKIRGFRIELGEIEAVLKRQKGVQDAVVLAREDQPGQKRLVAYIGNSPASNSDATPTKENLRAAVLRSLPEYMLPAAFVLMPALPLTPNGKVNRKALPAPEFDRSDRAGQIEQPATAAEKAVALIWQQVLRLKDPGVNENFFEVGGDSLQAIQVISRIQEQFKLRLPVTSMFEAPTIRELAEGIDRRRWGVPGPAEAPIRRVSREQNPQASFVQERLYFFDQLLPDSNANNVSTGWRLKGKLDLPKLEKALNELVQRHEALRTSFQFQDGILRQVICERLFVPIRFSDLEIEPPDGDAEMRAREFAESEARGLFDLANGPLIRASIARIAAEDHLFLIVMHHSICDGWSLGILFRELEEVYRAGMSGREPSLIELPVQYADFAVWRRESMQGELLESELAYWKQSLAGAPPELDLPTERPAAEVSMRAAHCELRMAPELSRELARFSLTGSGTTFHPLMAALAITLHKWTRQQDIVIGTVVAGRNRRETENVIGCFMNFLPIRIQVSPEATAAEVLARARTAVVQAQNHQDCPFEKIVEAINPERRLNRNPLYNVGLLFQNFPMHGFLNDDLAAASVPVPAEATVLDLRFEIEQDDAGFRLFCEYKADLFDQATMEHVLASLHQTLRLLMRAPHTKLSDFSTLAEAGVVKWEPPAPKQAIRVAATFTAEPLGEPLQFWLKELGVRDTVEFAPYNQVFQQLLDPNSSLMRNRGGLNVLLIRLEDWERAAGAAASPENASLERTIQEFLAALKAAAGRAESPWLVCFCPVSPSNRTNPTRMALMNETEKRLIDELESIGGLHVLTTAELERKYPVQNYYDAASEELGHVPYTTHWFTAMATAIARKYHALKRPPCKVIALDCDNTLWGGICGEDGPTGIRLDEPHLALQKFMIAQSEAGMLLCACSKNNEQDVRDVFGQRREMPLREEHFAAWRLNWAPKSENLKALAKELGLGLDSFVFIDDNPLECAEVEARCPEVLALQLPEKPEDIPAFLEHCWVFDRPKVTAEDKRRTEMYRQNREREQLRSELPNLADFIEGLRLQIDIDPLVLSDGDGRESQACATPNTLLSARGNGAPTSGNGQYSTSTHLMTCAEKLARVSQLTQRTNQFNFTTRRRTEIELQQLAERAEILTVSINDRFGDYGLAGAIIYEANQGSLDVDTFLLSCRVLGRGVEHCMLARLGELARERNLNWVDVHFVPSPKNRPALEFLESLGAPFRQAQNGGYLFRFPAAYAAEVTLELKGAEPQDVDTAGSAERARSSPPQLSADQGSKAAQPDSASVIAADGNVRVLERSEWRPIRSSQYRRIALGLNTTAAIHQAIESNSVVTPVKQTACTPPRTEAEKKLCAMWASLLRVERVGITDDFFELGGHSLLAVRLFADLETEFGRKLPLVTLFQSPTIAQLARALEDSGAAANDSLLVPLQPQGSQSPLFLVHGAGGDVLWGYANLTAHLPADQPVYGIKSRGQAGAEEFSRIQDMAACYVNEIRRRQPQGPYYIGGYCFGGNVAYEMARQIEAQGQTVALLALLDASPMNAGYETVPWWRPRYALKFARNLGYWLADFTAQTPKEMRRFAFRKLRTLGRKLLRGITRRSKTVDLEEVIDPTLFPSNELKLWEKHLQALLQHADGPYQGDVLLLRTRGQPLFCSLEDDFCWRKLVKGEVRTVLTPGSHENIFMEPNVQALAQRLKAGLAEAQQRFQCGIASK